MLTLMYYAIYLLTQLILVQLAFVIVKPLSSSSILHPENLRHFSYDFMTFMNATHSAGGPAQ